MQKFVKSKLASQAQQEYSAETETDLFYTAVSNNMNNPRKLSKRTSHSKIHLTYPVKV